MKKYYTGILAIIFATMCAAFDEQKKPSTLPDDVFFQYVPPFGGSYAEIDVENPDNWIEVSGLWNCGFFNEVACRILVDASTTTGTAPNRSLTFFTWIIAAEYGSTGKYYVLPFGDVIDVANKLE